MEAGRIASRATLHRQGERCRKPQGALNISSNSQAGALDRVPTQVEMAPALIDLMIEITYGV
jgi:hypothetical protein